MNGDHSDDGYGYRDDGDTSPPTAKDDALAELAAIRARLTQASPPPLAGGLVTMRPCSEPDCRRETARADGLCLFHRPAVTPEPQPTGNGSTPTPITRGAS